MATDISDDSVDSRLREGIALFNQGNYYACHDVLEAIWMEASTLEKPFYQGILQIAVGLYHLGNHNWQGASILLGEGVNRLRPFEPTYGGIDIERLVDCGWAWLTALHQSGPERVADVAAAALQAQKEPAAEVDSKAVVAIAGVEHRLPALHISA
ncbi:DUF309 domain-containing protein [Phormidium tenue]|uniref:DUF309 domain-containing protein n=1 Tax=Phormidium tenue NIES-30 TaxID=549789 RepID=A0A1U7J5S8_9CYAN|nr:DUF309 domain-containing protein [Phormidium tenue]MBD2232355.1 DUF309 domain-containing protein [Phormidium tenue FACHB-1052]OKH48150.1 hypothetical protein NIES30_11700 [Phormidium tenue NIES-30]